MGFIYRITNKINNKCYIGKTERTVECRFQEHLKNAKNKKCNNSHLYKAINCYGEENFVVEVLIECDNSILSDRERFYIALFRTQNENFGYNIADGGTGGNTFSGLTEEEFSKIKKKMTDSNKGRHWYHKGESECKFFDNDVPDGWIKGRSDLSKQRLNQQSKNLAYVIANTWSEDQKCEYKQKLSKGHKEAWERMTPEEKQRLSEIKSLHHVNSWQSIPSEYAAYLKLKISQRHSGKHIYTDGNVNILCSEMDCPEGFHLGRTHPKIDRQWYNNGVNETLIKKGASIPEGYIAGRLYHRHKNCQNNTQK